MRGFSLTPKRRASIRKAQRIRAVRQRAIPNKSKPRPGSARDPYQAFHKKSSDSIGKYANRGMKMAANLITVGVAGKWDGIVNPQPGGKKSWYNKIGKTPRKPSQRKR